MKSKNNEQNHHIAIDYDISVTNITHLPDLDHQKKSDLNRHL